jgi:hypothetical protein
MDIDFSNPEKALEELTEITLKVEEQCPYGTSFGIKGIGEGIVWRLSNDPENSKFWFKTKGEKHSGASKNKKKIASIAPEKMNTINHVLDEILPIWRLEQGIAHVKEKGMDIDRKNIGPYLAWIGQDVKKEEMDIIKANNLEWKDVTKFITQKAKDYFMEKEKLF